MSITAKARKRGFTLVELLVVVIIIAILAAIAIPKFTNASLRSKEASLKSELKMLRDAVELVKNDTGGYPDSLSDLTNSTANGPATVYNPVTGANMSTPSGSWKGPYISEVDQDPISSTNLFYDYTSGTVKASTSDTGNATDGTAYSSW